MAYAFDTLGYAKRLRDAGVPAAEAEAQAEAAREFIMSELVTRQDLEVSRRTLELAMQNMELRLEKSFETRIGGVETRMAVLEQRIESMELRLMVRLGGLMAVGVAILAAIIKF